MLELEDRVRVEQVVLAFTAPLVLAADLELAVSALFGAIEVCDGVTCLDVGCDLVEVSPPYDPTGNTALIAANFLYEMLCVLPGVPQNPSRFSGLKF